MKSKLPTQPGHLMIIKKRYCKLFFIITSLLSLSTTFAQTTNNFFGMNYWEYAEYSPGIITDRFKSNINEINTWNLGIIRIGGNYNNFKKNNPNSDKDWYVTAIVNAKSIGGTPLVQLPINLTVDQVAEWMDYFNITKNLGVIYWAIGNEPDPSAGTTNPDSWYANTAISDGRTFIQWAEQFKVIATKIKEKDPNSIICGPDFRNWYGTATTGAFGKWYKDFLYSGVAIGKATTQTGDPLIDIFTFHFYGNSGDFDEGALSLKYATMMDLINTTNASRPADQKLRVAVGEYQDNYNTTGFRVGQRLAIMTKLSLKNNAVFLAPWSLSEGAAWAMIDKTNGQFYSTAHHYKMICQNKRDNYMDSEINNNNSNDIVGFGMQDSNGYTVMLLNENTTTDFPYAVKFSTSVGDYSTKTGDTKFRFNTNKNIDFNGTLTKASTLLFTFDANGNMLKKVEYKSTDTNGPVTTFYTPVVEITSPNNNTTLTVGSAVTINATASSSIGTISKVEFYQGSTLLGESTVAPYSFNWTNPAVGNYVLTAKATDNLNMVTTSPAVNITVTSPPILLVATGDAYVRDGISATTNFPTGPLAVKKDATVNNSRQAFIQFDLSSFTKELESAKLQVYVASANSTVTAVNWEFYEVTDNSWTETGINWNNQPAVSSNLIATTQGKAAGNLISIPITATVLSRLNIDKKLSIRISSTTTGSTTDATFAAREATTINQRPTLLLYAKNVLPTVSLTAPTVNTIYNAPATVIITADAADTDGEVSKVEFFQGETKLGEALTAPYSFDWNNVAAGSYSIKAKVTDNSNTVTSSNVVNITVNALPTILITSPVTNASYDAPASVTITTDANDTDGSISKVEFFQGETKLGEALNTPYSFDWNNVTAGSYTITAKAFDNNGAVVTSGVVNISVVCPTVQVTIPDVYAMNPSVDLKNTIYQGYGPTSLLISAFANGSQNYTYNWNTGAQTSSISVTEAGTYTVTVSYAGGCQSSASITIKTIDVKCGNDNDKIQICHNNKVICVSSNAIQAHLDHGDKLGTCSSTAKIEFKKETANTSDVVLYPNPVHDNFYVTIPELKVNATISLYNALGNELRNIRFTNVPQEVFVGDLPVGTYFVVIQNGTQTIKNTIIKQ